MFGNLFIKARKDENLFTFASGVFRLLRLAAPSQRESENYINGEYLMGQALAITIKVALADDNSFAEYKFWMNFKADGVWVEDTSVFEGLADLVARKLVIEGYQVVRVPDFGKVGAPKLVYACRTNNLGSRDQIEVTTVP